MTTVLALGAAAAFGAAKVGSKAPEFTGTDILGKAHSLSDYRGKVVVIESYNQDCPFVVHHYKDGAMQELQAELTGKGVVWLIVNSTHARNSSYRTPSKAQAEWEKLKIKATAWLDDNAGTIGKAYGMRTTPHMFVVTRDGALAYDGAIDDNPSPSGDPRKARNFVREAVEAVLAGTEVAVKQTRPYGCGVKY
ncbi:MAG: redoxin domain-containing protein [Verrucomicrobiae bacterium]|nr:redoxin domain-containing protein [Verrucomicrobiae bacterium]